MTTSRQGAARAIAELTQGTILASVDIAAPVERVFSALTDPKEIVRWWGSPEAYLVVRDPEELKAIRAGDPAVAPGVGMRHELYPMPRAVVRQ